MKHRELLSCDSLTASQVVKRAFDGWTDFRARPGQLPMERPVFLIRKFPIAEDSAGVDNMQSLYPALSLGDEV